MKRPWLCVAFIWAATVAAETSAAAAADRPLRVHIISGAREYQSEASLKALREHLEMKFRMQFTASWGNDGKKELPNLEPLAQADLLVLFARRMQLGEAQMKQIRAHWEAGKPVVGIRTASHAFQAADNELFDRQVMGGNYQGHFGNEVAQVKNAQPKHPVLDGVGAFTTTKLYKAGPLAAGVVVLQHGDLGKVTHPVTWVNTWKGGRMFYTSLGTPEDFQNPNFRQLLINAIFWTTQRDPARFKREGPPQQ